MHIAAEWLLAALTSATAVSFLAKLFGGAAWAFRACSLRL